MDKVIEVSGLIKSYGNVRAVKGIDFYVERGQLFAFLGPNGAGKSTTIDIICTLLKQDGGYATINGFELGVDDDKIRASIGVVFQEGVLDKLLTVGENLRLRGGFYGLRGKKLDDAVKHAVSVTGADDILNRPYGKLSGGQKRRSDIARALLNTPAILFLDEPTTGLDPQTRQRVWETIETLRRETDMTIFLTTHYMEEAAAADYVVIIDDGLVSARGTPSELKSRYATDRLSLICCDQVAVKTLLDAQGRNYTTVAEQVMLKLPTTLEALPIIESCRGFISGFEVNSGTMDDVFIAVTGKEIRG
jgi:ABC-type multidrug transport system, ATPase component